MLEELCSLGRLGSLAKDHPLLVSQCGTERKSSAASSYNKDANPILWPYLWDLI